MVPKSDLSVNTINVNLKLFPDSGIALYKNSEARKHSTLKKFRLRNFVIEGVACQLPSS